MKKLYAPWRHNYVAKGLRETGSVQTNTSAECVFCSQFASTDDRKNLVLKRYKEVGVVLNHYPYSAGHLMVLPLAHKSDFVNLTSTQRAELMDVVSESIEVLKPTLKPQGFNVGVNLGCAGGGGIPSHLHIHILPRWNGDTNFLPLLADTKVVCSDLWQVYDQLKPYFK